MTPAPDEADDEVLERIRAAAVELDDSAELDELPLTEVADRLGEVHRELQGALADLDRA